jgi:hypothetical protein
MDTAGPVLSLVAIGVSIASLWLSIYTWRVSFRPIVSCAVQTHRSTEALITYNLVVCNSGKIPARNIRIRTDQASLEQAFGTGATEVMKDRWLYVFKDDTSINILLNDDRVSCSFGETRITNTGFWKWGARFSITISYDDWFGKRYSETQEIVILGSDSFTPYSWVPANE